LAQFAAFAPKTAKAAALKKPAAVIARRAPPGVAIQAPVDFIDFLDCFAALAMTILAGFLNSSAAR
jgi:hypothetical protein